MGVLVPDVVFPAKQKEPVFGSEAPKKRGRKKKEVVAEEKPTA